MRSLKSLVGLGDIASTAVTAAAPISNFAVNTSYKPPLADVAFPLREICVESDYGNDIVGITFKALATSEMMRLGCSLPDLSDLVRRGELGVVIQRRDGQLLPACSLPADTAMIGQLQAKLSVLEAELENLRRKSNDIPQSSAVW